MTIREVQRSTQWDPVGHSKFHAGGMQWVNAMGPGISFIPLFSLKCIINMVTNSISFNEVLSLLFLLILLL